MRKTDLSSLSKPHVHTHVSLWKPLRCGFAIVLCSCLSHGASLCRAQDSPSQDVAAAASQERTRKESEKKPSHIYTDEDLRRRKILTPEDEARLAAARKWQPPSGPAQVPDSLDAKTDLSQPSLGDVARHYRSAKRVTEPAFHLPAMEPALAAPMLPTERHAIPHSSVALSPAIPRIVPAYPKTIVSPAVSTSAPVRRVDPFSRRLGPIAPQAPIAPSRLVAPLAASAAKAGAPRAAWIPHNGLTANLKSVVPTRSPSPAARAAASQVVIVRPGDSLWKIAEQHLGRGSKWQELLAANPSIANPNILEVGTPLHVPTEMHKPRVAKVKVSAGDTLAKIAQAQYGRASYWRYIAEANPTVSNPNHIYEGQELILPSRLDP
jgi:LysM repeat protein